MSIKKENIQHILIHMKARKGLKFGGDRRAMMFFPGRIQQVKMSTVTWLYYNPRALAETARGSLSLRGSSDRSFENSREGHGETSRLSLR
ncbi:hypothetical protein E1A91_A11G306400v1 [Gossypium mustelinum]|uniref:Uncharacterized protein n=1 Tax=Gossypium mustelinum TaxID=34275 RepID=A0A5D2XCX0_GOSMU|nr:hypothetical protein E1A91_A11G306400v1 [Gossypium mustelinum]TYJ11860.1 hypothetical protein E1A91_A11G306400v1 [Gossypium mustelinum]